MVSYNPQCLQNHETGLFVIKKVDNFSKNITWQIEDAHMSSFFSSYCCPCLKAKINPSVMKGKLIFSLTRVHFPCMRERVPQHEARASSARWGKLSKAFRVHRASATTFVTNSCASSRCGTRYPHAKTYMRFDGWYFGDVLFFPCRKCTFFPFEWIKSNLWCRSRWWHHVCSTSYRRRCVANNQHLCDGSRLPAAHTVWNSEWMTGVVWYLIRSRSKPGAQVGSSFLWFC